MAIASGQSLGPKLCEVLGLEPGRVRSINIDVQPYEVTVVVGYVLNMEDAPGMCAELREYRLVERGDPVREELPTFTNDELDAREQA